MKNLLKSGFFRVIKDAALTGVPSQLLKKDYDNFVKFIILESQATAASSAVYRYSLIYTRAELASLYRVAGEKYGCLY